MYEKRIASLSIFDTAPYGPENNGNYSQTSFIRTTLFCQIMSV